MPTPRNNCLERLAVPFSALSANRTSVKETLRLLTEMAGSADDATFDEVTETDLCSQGALTRMDVPSRDIHPMSLNTCKRIANDSLPGGFAQLDDARKLALELVEHRNRNKQHVGRRTKRALLLKISDLERANATLEQDLWNLSDAFAFAMNCARRYAKTSGRESELARYRLDECEMRARASMVRTRLVLIEESKDGKTTP